VSSESKNETSILIIDDDRAVLDALADELSEHYAVSALDSGEAALELLEKQQFEAIICDVRMPGMGGVELMRKVQNIDPHLVRILLTGFQDDAALEAAWMPGGVYKVGKPWGDELEIILRRALEQRAVLLEAQQQLGEERQAREQAELSVHQLDKMASLGTLSAGIAHEMRTPLAFIKANIDWLKTSFGQHYPALFNEDAEKNPADKNLPESISSELKAVLNDCQEGVVRLSEILEGLRGYAAPSSANLKDIDIRECIEQAVRLVSFKYKHTVEIHTALETAMPHIRGHEGELSQVVINLIVNGVQAMKEKGNIYVRATSDTESLRISVEDEGPGVPEEILPRLFEPFFTTKSDEINGNGLGLSISLGIARRHGGDLLYENGTHGGARFILELPL
jgi:signal transduction histidine kinase